MNRCARRAAPFALAAAAVLGLPGAAGAVSFGADLSAPANSTSTCDAGGFSNTSCTFFSTAPGPSLFAPASGTVTQIRVKTGNGPQGPMQVVVLAQLYQNKAGDPGHPYTACCFVEAYGPTFTPAAGTVTSVPTSLPMVEQAIPAPNDFSSSARGDFLALSVLEPGVAIPAASSSAGYFVFAPSPDPGTSPAPSPNPYAAQRGSDGFGFHLMLAADEAPNGTGLVIGPRPTLRPPRTRARPALTLPGHRVLPVRRGIVSVPLQCRVTAACRGHITLQSAPAAGARAAGSAGQRITYARASFSFAAGRSGAIKLALLPAGRSASGRHRRLRAYANVSFSTGGGRTLSFPVTLSR